MIYFDIDNLFIIKNTMKTLINDKKYIFDTLIGIFPENIIRQIIVKTFTKECIKNFIGDETVKYIMNNPTLTSSYYSLSCNSKITLDTVEKYINAILWNFAGLSANPNLTIEFVEKYIDKPWNFDIISANLDISIEEIKQTLISHGKDIPKSLYNLSFNGLSERIINLCLHESLDWNTIINVRTIGKFMDDKYAETMNELEKFRRDEEIFQ